jgi:UDP-N-acetylmuramoyl-tripeptide--D-alanyl-D-alanine ligase
VLGDMLELGDDAPGLHAGLAKDIHDNQIDLLFTAGPQMAHLSEVVEPERRGAHAGNSAALIETVVRAVRPGDVVLVKGSLGSRMAPIVEALLDLADAPVRAANG